MSRTLIFAIIFGTATASYEWKGVFYTPEDSYTWKAQKVSGSYADPSMVLVAIPVSNASQEALTSADSAGTNAMGLTCQDVQSGGKITPKDNTCYKLVFNQQTSESNFVVDATGVAAIAFFAEHMPTEFEETEHYFKDLSGVDIEPQAQAPDPSEGGHSHGHGSEEDPFSGKCVCQAQKHGWKIDCADTAMIQKAVADLKANSACAAKGAPEDCDDNYHVMQAHHDHCLHNQLPTGIEKDLHDYEHYYEDCFIKRQFDTSLGACSQVDCSNAQALTAAVQTLQAGCATEQECATASCSAAIKTVLMAHDTCPESSLPNNLEAALHDHEDPCAAQLCNTGSAVFDPYDELCSAEVSAASGFGTWEAFLVTSSVLPFAMLI